MTATVTRIHPGRPPAAPAPTHTCVRFEVVDWRDGRRIYRVHDTCKTCGRSLLPGLEVVK